MDDPTVYFSLIGLIAKSLFNTLKMALMMPVFLVSMFLGIVSPIAVFVDLSPLIGVVGVIVSLAIVMGIGRLFGFWGR
jgi:hypothetical protein